MGARSCDRNKLSSRFPWWLRVTLLAVLPAGVAAAQPPDTSNWTCQRCPFRTGYAANYSAGASHLSDDSAHFGDASGYDGQGGYLNLDADGILRDEGRQIRWYLEDVGLDSRVLGIEGGRQGRYGYSFEYGALPRRQFDTTQTIFSAADPNVLKLPDDWVRAGTTAGFSALNGNLSGRNVESDRETIQIGGRFLSSERLDFFADYGQTHREGSNVQGAAFYSNASLLPRPFDYTTDELDIGVRYRSNRSNVKLAYYGSFFGDDSLMLSWENPFTAAVGAETGQLARPPDSSFQQLMVSGDFRPSLNGAMFTYSAARGLMEQDDAFLAYTANPSIPMESLPRSSLDGRVATTNVAWAATLRPLRQLRLKAAYRYDDRNNRTPVELWRRVIAETLDSGELTANTPYSFKRSSLSLQADYDLGQRLRLSAGYDDREWDRDYQEIANQDEASGWTQLSWQPNAYVDLRARGGTAKREAGEYNTSLAQNLGQNPLMRKYHLAYRYREFAELTLAASLPNRPISLGATLRIADDSYTKSELGLLTSNDQQFALDVSWSLAESTSVYFLYAFNQIDSAQAGSEQAASPDWNATITDEFRSFGAGLRAGALTERLSVEIDYTYGRGDSETNVAAASGRPGRFPDMTTRLDSLRLRFGYDIAERLQAFWTLRYQHFEAEDWALQGVGPATLPNVLTLGASPYDYDVFLIGVSIQYSVGD